MLANFTVYDDYCNHSKGISKRLFFVMKAIMRRAYKDKLKTIFSPSDIYPLDFDYGVYQGMEIISSDLLVEDAAIYDIYKSLGVVFLLHAIGLWLVLAVAKLYLEFVK